MTSDKPRKRPPTMVDMRQVEYIKKKVSKATAVIAWMNYEESSLFRYSVQISTAKKKEAQDIENAIYTEAVKKMWLSVRRYGFVMWSVGWNKTFQMDVPEIHDPGEHQSMEFTTSRDGTRRWKRVDLLRERHNVYVFERNPVGNDGTLTSEMADLIPAVAAYEADRAQYGLAMNELACMPRVIESELVRDPTSRTQLTMQTAAIPGAMGASGGYPSGSTVSLDAASMMTARGYHPQTVAEQKQQLASILEGHDTPVVVLPPQLLTTGLRSGCGGDKANEEDDCVDDRRRLLLMKPGFKLVQQPLAMPFLPDLRAGEDRLENAVSQVSSTSRIFWSDFPVDRSEAAERIATQRHEAQTALMREFLRAHLENIYLYINNDAEAVFRTLYGIPSYSKFEMPVSVTPAKLETLLKAQIITKAEYRDYMAKLAGITMSPEAQREAAEADEREKQVVDFDHEQHLATPPPGSSDATAGSGGGDAHMSSKDKDDSKDAKKTKRKHELDDDKDETVGQRVKKRKKKK